MSTFTCTSRVKGKVNVTDRFDLSAFNPCKVHGVKPTIFEIKWGRGNREYTAECVDEGCLMFGGLNPDPKEARWNKWNKFNPLPDAVTAPDAIEIFSAAVAGMTEGGSVCALPPPD